MSDRARDLVATLLTLGLGLGPVTAAAAPPTSAPSTDASSPEPAPTSGAAETTGPSAPAPAEAAPSVPRPASGTAETTGSSAPAPAEAASADEGAYPPPPAPAEATAPPGDPPNAGEDGPAAPAAAPSPSAEAIARLDALVDDAQGQLAKYQRTGDSASLQAGRDLLVKWLADHEALYGRSEAAIQTRQPTLTLVGTLDQTLHQHNAAEALPRTTAPAPPPAPSRNGRGFRIAGAVFLPLGASVIFLVGLPALGLHRRSLDKARDAELRREEELYLAEALRRRSFSRRSILIGAVLAAGGITMLAIGSHRRQRHLRRASVAPTFGPDQASITATIRF